MSKNRYQSLDVSLNNIDNASYSSTISPQKKKYKRFNNTIDFNISQGSIPESTFVQNDDRNQILRKELKLLNTKLNEKLEKVKLAPIKNKKAKSVDLNVNKPSKALQKQLENAYRQVQMYKKRIATLKVKEESESTYDKFKTLDNDISFKDIEIMQVEEELKSIKMVKKLQDRTLVQDVGNQDLKNKLQDYRKEFKQGQARLKEISKKARKREQQYKKQQAYQVALEKKLRKGITENLEEEKHDEQQDFNHSIPEQKQVDEEQFNQVKAQIAHWKDRNQNLQKKLDLYKKNIRDIRKQRQTHAQQHVGIQVDLKALNSKFQSFTRLIKDYEKKTAQKQNKQYNTNFNSINSENQTKFENKSLLKLKDTVLMESGNQDDSEDSIYSDDLNDLSASDAFDMQAVQSSIQKSIQKISKKNDQREWTGKPRKVSFGFMNSTDAIQKLASNFKGLKIYIDESQFICGLVFIYKQSKAAQSKLSKVIGKQSDIELRWDLKQNDQISNIDCSFTVQGYLSQILISTAMNGLSAKFGINESADKYSLSIDSKEQISGVSVGLRKLGQDIRVTQLCFWLSPKAHTS